MKRHALDVMALRARAHRARCSRAKNFPVIAYDRSAKVFPQREKSCCKIDGALMSRNSWTAVLAALVMCVAQAAHAQNAGTERGMKVYVDQKCSVCHSIAGKGNAKGALDDVGSRLTAEEIRLWVVSPAEMTKKTKAERKPPMRAYPNLPKEDLDGLVAYMLSLKKK
jgi:mono/diheme cytochrome c family protein